MLIIETTYVIQMDTPFQHCSPSTWYNIEVWTSNSGPYPSNVHSESWISLCVQRREPRKNPCNPRGPSFAQLHLLLQAWTVPHHSPAAYTSPWNESEIWACFSSFTCTPVLELAQLPRDCTLGRCSYTAETQQPVGRMNSPFSVQSRQCAQAALGSPLGQHTRSWRKQEHSSPR